MDDEGGFRMTAIRFEVSEELLRAALHMPETSRILDIQQRGLVDPIFVFFARDANIPTPKSGADIITAYPQVTRHDDSYEWDWRLDDG
jgi:hypothetical protein